MKSFIVYSFSLFLALTLSACSKDKIPGVYRIDIQQGNNVSQEMLNQLEPGMSKNQVAYIMGTPLLIDTFHPDRWDYIYSYQPGNGDREQRRITLFFDENEKLDHIDGNTTIVAREDRVETQQQENNVVVPLTEKKTGLFSGLMNMIGLGDDEEIIEDTKAETESQDSPAATSPEEAAEQAGDEIQ